MKIRNLGNGLEADADNTLAGILTARGGWVEVGTEPVPEPDPEPDPEPVPEPDPEPEPDPDPETPEE